MYTRPACPAIQQAVPINGHNLRFTFSGGDAVFTAATGTPGIERIPFNNTSLAKKVQLLYTKEEINGFGPIVGVAVPIAYQTSAATFTMTMRLGHSVLTELTPTYNENFSGTPVTVASDVQFRVPSGMEPGAHVWLPMSSGTFTYNGTDNLIAEIEVSSSTGTVAWQANAGYPRNVRLSSDAGAVAGTPEAVSHGIKFRFKGGSMNVLTGGNSMDHIPFISAATTSAAGTKRQSIYPAALLGTKGGINKVAFRIATDSVPGTYGNVEIVMGHTLASHLSNGFAFNMIDAAIVSNSTLTIPAGMKRGDWIEIPLNTAFAYDGTSNLVVQVASDVGTADNLLVLEGWSNAYPDGRLVSESSRTATIGTLSNYQLDQRLWLQP